MPTVASTPIIPFLLASAAGLTAGSIPIIGKLYLSRMASIAAAVAVLQATTSALAPLAINKSAITKQRDWISSAVLLPYGAY